MSIDEGAQFVDCTVRAYVGVDLLPPGGSLIVQCSSVMESSSNFYDLADLADLPGRAGEHRVFQVFPAEISS